MPKYKVVTQQGKNYSNWIFPNDRLDYRIACCDCGLVHDMQFAVMRVKRQLSGNRVELTKIRKQERFQVAFCARRNNRATTQKRRYNARSNGTKS